ncbi:MAG: hypothetical protein ABIP95_08770 [Pelobium sp.]
MKKNIKYTALPLLCIAIILLSSCEKSYMNEIDAIAPKVSLTPIEGGIFLLKKEKITIPADSSAINASFGVVRSGTQQGEAFKVDIITSASDIAAGSVALPSSVFSQTEVEISGSDNKGVLHMSIPMTFVKANLGKKLAIRMSIANPTKYELNSSLSSAMVILDVNDYFTPPPPPDPLPKYLIVDEVLRDGWGNWGWSREVDYTNSERKKKGSSSAKVTYTDAWGAFQVHAPGNNNVGVALAGYTTLKIAIYTSAAMDGKEVKLSVNELGNFKGEKVLKLKGGEFTTFLIPFSALGNPTSISDVIIQNQGTTGLVMYIDDFGFD